MQKKTVTSEQRALFYNTIAANNEVCGLLALVLPIYTVCYYLSFVTKLLLWQHQQLQYPYDIDCFNCRSAFVLL